MNTKLLKQKILDLAIRGKLTQQLKSDGTAADLLKEISDAKSALSQPKGKKSKDLGRIIPLDKSEAPFEIPANWEWVRLGDLSESIQYGYNAPAKDNGRIKMVRISDIHENEVEWETVPFCDIDEADIKIYSLKKNDILFARTGGTVGKSYIVNDLPEEAVYAGYLIRTRYSENISAQYMKFFMESALYWDQLKDGCIATAQPNCNGKTLGKMQIPLPPFAEQQRIVEKIQEAFAEIDSIENNKELLKTHIKQARQKILDLAIHGKLVPQNKADEPASVLLEQITRDNPHYEKLTDVPFEIPESWEWVKLGDVVEINPKNKLDDNLEVSFIPMNLIEAGYSNRHKQESRFWKDVKKGFTHFAENDVALAKISPCFENRKSAIMKNLKNGYGAGTTELFVFRSSNVMLPSYLLWIIKSDDFIQAGTGNFSGVVGQQRLSREIVENYHIALPPLAEQKRIVNKIEEIFASLNEISLHLV